MCGCEVNVAVAPDGQIKEGAAITFCPAHGAGPKLLEAAKYALDSLSADSTAAKKLRAAIEHARPRLQQH